MNGGEGATAWALMNARSRLSEARARYAACPWSEKNFNDVEACEKNLELAVDAHIDAMGYAKSK